MENISIIKGSKWGKTPAPQPFKTTRKRCSHDCSYKIGRRTYGITKADSDSESLLLEDYGNHIAIWNAYENNRIIISSELAAVIKTKIEYYYEGNGSLTNSH